MTTNWSQEKHDCSTRAQREAERSVRIHPKSLVPRATSRIEHLSTNRVEAESLPTVGYAQWKMWFVAWNVMLAALAGVMIFFILNVASFGVLGSAVTVAGIVAVVGLGHYLFWARVFARGVVRQRQRVQDRARRLESNETEPPDEFSLGLNDRERMELLQLLEHSLAAAEGRERSEDSAAIRRELQERISMFRKYDYLRQPIDEEFDDLEPRGYHGQLFQKGTPNVHKNTGTPSSGPPEQHRGAGGPC
jgi:hypothetical protein